MTSITTPANKARPVTQPLYERAGGPPARAPGGTEVEAMAISLSETYGCPDRPSGRRAGPSGLGRPGTGVAVGGAAPARYGVRPLSGTGADARGASVALHNAQEPAADPAVDVFASPLSERPPRGGPLSPAGTPPVPR
ncbi:hypothetical protein GCM10009663_30580 [Kitasatospora arboriphila]|uniref:Uncharacterized protein n=1 Tax=Kitasatospora arboriphila TaxID=258052 RepID=A0ABN1THU3_9ACTN